MHWNANTTSCCRKKLRSHAGTKPALIRFGHEVAVNLKRLPQPGLRNVRTGDRAATEFKQRCEGLEVKGVKVACKQKGKFVGGGFRPATKSFSFLLVGSIDGEKLGFTGKVRHGFDHIRRVGVRDRQTLRTRKCSFTNLPHCKAGPFDEDVAPEETDSLV